MSFNDIIIYNYKCPICGELGEYNFQAEAEFFIVEMKCHKCGHKFICSNE